MPYGNDQRMRLSTRALAAFSCLALGAYVIVVRPRLLRWGASDEELARPYPGADIVPKGNRAATIAVTIDAPPDRVWPWLVQMGYDRAGWATCVGVRSTPQGCGRVSISKACGVSCWSSCLVSGHGWW